MMARLLGRAALAWLLCSALHVSLANARPGGGSSFSGSRSSSSSSSRSSSGSSRSSSSSSSRSSSYTGSRSSSYSGGHSGGFGVASAGDDGTRAAFTVLVIIAIIAAFIYFVFLRSRRSDWGTMDSEDSGPAEPFEVPGGDLQSSFEQLRQSDPDFSPIVFEDFLYALYAEAHGARNPRRLSELAPFLDPAARTALDGIHQGAVEVSEFVIGSMRVNPLRFSDDGQMVEVDVDYETNYTERSARGAQSWLSIERWTLRRLASARSRPPEQARVFQCPSCGASLQGMQGSTCSFCRQVVDTGRFDWVVVGLRDAGREARPPMLTADVEERGTNRPTITDDQYQQHHAALRQRDPQFDINALGARVGVIFGELQVAWSNRDWKRARPFVSDSLFQMQLGYMEAYQRARLRNVTENARIEALVPVKVAGDRHYDAITLRLYASSLDYTISDAGQLVAGRRDRPRRYSEYWTLIRGVGVRGRPRADLACPNCGAPLKINMAGNCEYCRSRIGLGEFDWVLSRIEQDEVYRG